MNRSSLQRKAGLRRVAMPPRTVPLKRSPWRRSPTELGLRKPGRPRVTAEERRARRLVKRRSGNRCEVQIERWCLGGSPTFHHRMDKSLGGPWTAPNGMTACGSGTTGCHGWITEHPAGSRPHGWSVRSHIDPRRTPVLRRGRWVLLLDDGSLITLRSNEVVMAVDGSEPIYLGPLPVGGAQSTSLTSRSGGAR